MKFFNSLYANIKRFIKSPGTWLSFVIAPVLMFLLYFVMFSSDSLNTSYTGVVIEDRGTKYEEIMDIFGEEPNIIKTREEALKKLENYDIKVLYIIDEDFSSNLGNNVKPQVEKLFVDDSGFKMEDKLLNERIVEIMEENYLKEQGIDKEELIGNSKVSIVTENKNTEVDMFVNLIMLVSCFLMMLLSGSIGLDIITISKNRILIRLLLSPIKNFKSILSLFLTYLLLLGSAFSIATLIGFKILNIELISILTIVLIVFSIASFTLSFIVLIVRLGKREFLLSIVPMVIAMVSFFTAAFTLNSNMKLGKLEYLLYLNPLYWVQKVLETNNLINLIPIILMSVVLLSFGSYKLEKLQNI